MPILGIIASQNYVRTPATSFESISTVNVGAGGSSSISFSSIPSTFKHLQIRMIARTTRTGPVSDYALMTFNSDTAANYSSHNIYGDGLSAYSFGNANQSGIYIERFADGTSASNIFGVAIVDILDYQNTNKYKTSRSLGGVELNTGSQDSQVHLYSGNWRNTSAISTITLTAQAGSANFTQYSSFALYGIRG